MLILSYTQYDWHAYKWNTFCQLVSYLKPLAMGCNTIFFKFYELFLISEWPERVLKVGRCKYSRMVLKTIFATRFCESSNEINLIWLCWSSSIPYLKFVKSSTGVIFSVQCIFHSEREKKFWFQHTVCSIHVCTVHNFNTQCTMRKLWKLGFKWSTLTNKFSIIFQQNSAKF